MISIFKSGLIASNVSLNASSRASSESVVLQTAISRSFTYERQLQLNKYAAAARTVLYFSSANAAPESPSSYCQLAQESYSSLAFFKPFLNTANISAMKSGSTGLPAFTAACAFLPSSIILTVLS